MVDTCTWVQDDEYSATWHADCGASFTFNDEGPDYHGFLYCYNCGKSMITQVWEPDEDEDEDEDEE